MSTKTIISVVVAAIALAACTPPSQSSYTVTDVSEPLILSLSIDKDAYQADEPIYAMLTIANTSNTDVIIKKRMAANARSESVQKRDVVFIINSPTGYTSHYKPKTNVFPVEDSDFASLPAGEKIEQIYDLRDLYYIDEHGTHSVFVIYQNSSDPSNGTAWRGELVSNVVLFTINP